jgi:hypothetical protein
MKLPRAIHFDESDTRVFHNPARTGEWCVSGGFEFSNWSEGDLVGKARQAFANGWMGIETYGAPNLEAAKNVALEEIAQMAELSEDHAPNTLLTVSRELTPAGVKETYRAIEAQDADIMQFAVHGSLDEDEPHEHGHDHGHHHHDH